jgi:hypothetical protein
MTKIQSASGGSNVLVIEYWNLRFICNLVLVIWDFKSLRNTMDIFQQCLNPVPKLPTTQNYPQIP